MISLHCINKSYAMNTKTYKSMRYNIKTRQGEAQAEARFPLRKFLYTSCLSLFLLTAGLLPATSVQADPFYQRVESDLTAYARLQQWQNYSYDIALWLPGKAKQLPRCATGVKFKPASAGKAPLARVSYLISCAEPKWRIRAHAKIKVWLDVWHAKTDIAVNQRLTPQLIQLKKAEISKLTRGFVTDPGQLLNQRSLRRIRAGKVISPQQLQHPFLVNRGDEVIIKASSETFVATMKGKALQNGKQGDRIVIENLSSGKRIQAKVTGEGIVETLF